MYYIVTCKNDDGEEICRVESGYCLGEAFDHIRRRGITDEDIIDCHEAKYVYGVFALPYGDGAILEDIPSQWCGLFPTESDAVCHFQELVDEAYGDTELFISNKDKRVHGWCLQVEKLPVLDNGKLGDMDELIMQDLITDTWYAILKDREDSDCGTGSFNYDTAVQMAKDNNCKYIATVINNNCEKVEEVI